MAHRNLIATRTGRYGTRMLTAGDELYVAGPQARAMIALGDAVEKPARNARAVQPAEPMQHDEISAVREEYEKKLGKRPYMGWDIATLREKIAEA